MILNCNVCIKEQSNKAEPWQKIGTDLFELKGKPYILCIDYFLRFAEVALLSKSTTAPDEITHLKTWFARHGIPDSCIGQWSQFQANEFAKFADDYGFKHEPSSPKYPQSNGKVERAVKTVKSLLRKSTDPYLALMAYCSTSLENGYAPSELLFGRKIRTTVPVLPSNLLPSWPQMAQLNQKNNIKEKQKHYFNQHHRFQQLPEVSQGQTVWTPDRKENGEVVDKRMTPRSYVVKTPTTAVHRNRRHLILSSSPVKGNSVKEGLTPHPPLTPKPVQSSDTPDEISKDSTEQNNLSNNTVQTKSGRVVKPPKRLVM